MTQLFLACPHRCLAVEDMETMIANYIVTETLQIQSDFLDTIKDLARSTLAINGSFAGSPALSAYRILNIYPQTSIQVSPSLLHHLIVVCPNEQDASLEYCFQAKNIRTLELLGVTR